MKNLEDEEDKLELIVHIINKNKVDAKEKLELILSVFDSSDLTNFILQDVKEEIEFTEESIKDYSKDELKNIKIQKIVRALRKEQKAYAKILKQLGQVFIGLHKLNQGI